MDLSHYLGILVNLNLINLTEEFDYDYIKDELEIRFGVYASVREITNGLEEIYYHLKYDSEYREIY